MGTALVIGIIVGLALVACLLRFMNSDKKLKTEYDERQKAVRGRSYMYGFYGIVFSNLIMIFIMIDFPEFITVMGTNAFVTPILIGIIVQVSHAIFNDSYKGLNNNMNRYMIFMTFISIFNIAVGILPWVREGFIQDGEIYLNFINLEVGIMFIIICIEMAIKKAIDKREEVDE